MDHHLGPAVHILLLGLPEAVTSAGETPIPSSMVRIASARWLASVRRSASVPVGSG